MAKTPVSDREDAKEAPEKGKPDAEDRREKEEKTEREPKGGGHPFGSNHGHLDSPAQWPGSSHNRKPAG